MRKDSWREKLRYSFDNYMGRGTIALIGMLFLITALVVIIAGIFSHALNGDGTTGNYIWQSLMHVIDAGTIAGDDTSHAGFIILMSIVTICGIFVTSILIGIISAGFEEKLNSLKKGFSRVLESNHTVIIGFNEGIYTILTELIEANSNHKNGRILVIGTEDKEEMEIAIRSHITDFKTTKVICRSGNPTHSAVLEMSSVETARSIIINVEDDFTMIRCLLSAVSYLKDHQAFDGRCSITAVVHDQKNLEAAKIAGEGNADIIYFKDMIARVVANTCRQPGLSSVLTDMFNFGGDEFYYESFPELAGKQFGDVLNLFRISTVVGIGRDGKALLNPPMDTVLRQDDMIIHLAADDGVSKPSAALPEISLTDKLSMEKPSAEEPFHLLILGINDSLPLILTALSDFIPTSSHVTVANDTVEEDTAEALRKAGTMQINVVCEDIFQREVLERLLTPETKNVLLLSDGDDNDTADARNLLLLLQLRDFEVRRGMDLNITSEMYSTENQRLMKVAKVNDFVVGSSITNLIMTQIAENRQLYGLFTTLLTSEGSELYMKDVRSYLKPGIRITFFEATEAVKQHAEILIGYRRNVNGELQIITNPDKAETVTFQEDDALIVLAED